MPNVKALEITAGIPGVSCVIWYSDANLRIGNVDAIIPNTGVSVRARIYDDGQLMYDRTFGQGSYSETVPGNYRVVEVTEFGETFYDLPPNLTYNFNIETIGA